MNPETVRSVLRADAFNVALAIVIITASIASAALFAASRRVKDPAILWFAVFSGLYGVRLVIQTDTAAFVFSLGKSFQAYATATITYIVILPAVMFIYEVIPTWRPVLRWLFRALVVFAIAGIVTDQVLRRPGSLQTLNNVFVLVYSVLFIAMLFWRTPPGIDIRPVRVGVLPFAAAVIVANVGALGAPELPFNPEPFGFAIFLGSLGWIVAQRAMRTQERLTAIENELEIARRIQLSILPREMPKAGWLSVAARYLPMTAVAGDFYDFLIVDQKRMGVLVADVSGHGVPAALIASMVKVAIAAQLPHADDPAKVVRGMNQTLCGKLQGQFVTAAYLFLDFENQKMRYAAAGHPPMMWAHDGAIEPVVENGLLLGIMAAAPYQSVERDMRAGDRFFLYTDGLVEAANQKDEFFGEERLRDALNDAGALPADACAAKILDRLADWAGYDRGRSQDDDLTVVVVDIMAPTA